MTKVQITAENRNSYKPTTSIFQRYAPTAIFPCVVQINIKEGVIRFYIAEDAKDAENSYLGKIIAIFKPKKIKNDHNQ